MNGLILVAIAVMVLLLSYLLYGGWLSSVWDLEQNTETPAIKYKDNKEFSPASKISAFASQFNSIAGVGAVTGPIIAIQFGWLPVFLWLLIGGVFFGAVQDCASLYASVKNDGKSMGFIIEKYIGKTGKILFLIFCWLFSLIVIASFADILAKAFSYINPDGSENTAGTIAASISMLYIIAALVLGIFLKFVNVNECVRFLIALILVPVMICLGFIFPLKHGAEFWRYVVFIYCFVSSIIPLWLLKAPRDYFSIFLFVLVILGGALGIIIAAPSIEEVPVFTGFYVNNLPLFPILFVTVACGAVSGFHSIISSSNTSKMISKNTDILPAGYGAMLLEVMLAVIALVAACTGMKEGNLTTGNPLGIFSRSVANLLTELGLPVEFSTCIMVTCVTDLATTTIDSVARIGRTSWQELFTPENKNNAGFIRKFITNDFIAAFITLAPAFLLCLGGYEKIWPLFGSANQLLSALVLTALAVFLKATGRKGWMLYIPMLFMFVVTMSALIFKVYEIYTHFMAGHFIMMSDGLQFILALALMALALIVVFKSWHELFRVKFQKEVQK